MILRSMEACNESARTCIMDGEFELAISAVLRRSRWTKALQCGSGRTPPKLGYGPPKSTPSDSIS